MKLKEIFDIEIPKSKGLIQYGLKIIDESYDFNEAKHVQSSKDAYECISLFLFSTSYNIYEHSGLITLNQANRVTGYYLLSMGGVASTILDIKLINVINVLSLSSNCIIFHTHPSGNPMPSNADNNITSEISISLKQLKVSLLDHIIICPNNDKTIYYSYLDNGNSSLIS